MTGRPRTGIGPAGFMAFRPDGRRGGGGTPGGTRPRHWRSLAFVALAQLMVVLDSRIVDIALPSAQRELGMSDGNRRWAITACTAYSPAFGGLLLLGGRIADLVGR